MQNPNRSHPDAVLYRFFRRSRSDKTAIAVGSGLSPEEYRLPQLAGQIIDHFKPELTISSYEEAFDRWNTLVSEVESSHSRDELVAFLQKSGIGPEPARIHYLVAHVPVSNFIDSTFDRSLYRALKEVGREPVVFDFDRQFMGSWRKSTPEKPNLFFTLPSIHNPSFIDGVSEPVTGPAKNAIQIENIGDMLLGKDLALLGIGPGEAESILHLERLCAKCDKICVPMTRGPRFEYWPFRGVFVGTFGVREMVEYLLPSHGKDYGAFDAPGLKFMVDAIREKQWDCFISYFSGDDSFVSKLTNDLKARDVVVWRDETEILVGDSITDRIEEGLTKSYCFIIVITPEALERPWVQEELRAAYTRRRAGNLKILPVLYQDSEIPLFLADYKYADFRDGARYHEQLGLLEYSIKQNVRRARKKG